MRIVGAARAAPDRVRLGSRALLPFVLAACARPSAPAAEPSFKIETPAPPPKPAWSWSADTRSPWPAPELEARLEALTAACGQADGALARAAGRVAAARLADERDPDRVSTLLRAEGEPHVRPRVVFAHVRGPVDDDALRATLAAARAPSTRCGVAIASGPVSGEQIGAVLVDALADLDPLPTRARTGQWLTFSAKMHVPITGARLVVLGPRGLPRTVPTTVERGAVKARFALDRPGDFLVQLVADRETGPEPVLEARVFADVSPPIVPAAQEVPGLVLGYDAHDPELLMAEMIANARSADELPALKRDPRLDALARTHANAMRHERRVAHDLGEGDLARRFESAGLVAKSVGENVVRAGGYLSAHEALYASPSHRMNLLGPYTHVGVGLVRDETGAVWVCEVFAEGLR